MASAKKKELVAIANKALVLVKVDGESGVAQDAN